MSDNTNTLGSEGDALRGVLKAFPDLEVAVLFGSLARGDAGAQSDVDLAVRFRKPLAPERKMTLIDALAEVAGRPVDLVDLHRAGEPLLGRILREGILLHGTSSDRAALVYRHLVDQEDFGPIRRHMLEGRRRAWIGNL